MDCKWTCNNLHLITKITQLIILPCDHGDTLFQFSSCCGCGRLRRRLVGIFVVVGDGSEGRCGRSCSGSDRPNVVTSVRGWRLPTQRGPVAVVAVRRTRLRIWGRGRWRRRWRLLLFSRFFLTVVSGAHVEDDGGPLVVGEGPDASGAVLAAGKEPQCWQVAPLNRIHSV